MPMRRLTDRAIRIIVPVLLGIMGSPNLLQSQEEAQAPSLVSEPRTIGKLDAFENGFHELIAADAVIEVLAEGFHWTEGPVWMPESESLLFSDIPRNAIYRWSPRDGLTLFLKPAGYTEEGDGGYRAGGRYRSEPGTNGLTRDLQGRLVMCEHGNRRVSVLLREGDAIKQTLASHYQGKRLNSPNDAVLASNGDLYFTDPPYGRPLRFEDPSRELNFCGVYRLSATGELTLLTDEMTAPNGIGLSPDNKTLYVAQSDGRDPIWRAFDLAENGRVTGTRVFQDARPWMGQGLPGGCDGMAIDQSGRLFATGPGGVYVFTPDGEALGRITTGRPTSNCAFGDDGSTLYMTVNDLLCRIATRTQGLGF
jgi:gluconolactonase